MCPFFSKQMRQSDPVNACSCYSTNACDKRVPRSVIPSYVILFIEGLLRTLLEIPQIMTSQGNFHAANACGKRRNPTLLDLQTHLCFVAWQTGHMKKMQSHSPTTWHFLKKFHWTKNGITHHNEDVLSFDLSYCSWVFHRIRTFWINVGLALVRRRRRWTNAKPTLIHLLEAIVTSTHISMWIARCCK